MKLLLANKFFFRNGGSEVVMFQERDFLKSQGIEVVDFSMQDGRNLNTDYASYFVSHQSYEESSQGAIGKIRSALSFVHSREAVKKIGAVIDAERPDIVHCHNIYHQLTPSIIGAAKRRGVSVVLTLHDYKTVCPTYLRLRHGKVCSDCLGLDFVNVLTHRCADNSLGKSALLYAEAVVQRLMGNYEKVDLLLAPSRFMAESVTGRFVKEQVFLLYNGIDVGRVAPSTEDGNYALYMGRLSAEKGIRTLLEAHAAIADGLDLVVAGTGPLEQSLKEKYRRARFVGHLTGQALRDAVASASLVVVPSECFENCPMSVLEAMAYGKPVVATNMGGIPELVTHGETGLLFEAGDARGLSEDLSTLAKDRALRQRFGAAGRTRVETHFSLEKHNDGLLNAYKSLF